MARNTYRIVQAVIIAVSFVSFPIGRAGAVCAGDCNGDGQVLINEVVAAVNVFLEISPLSLCGNCDQNRDSRVLINEVVAAVNSFLDASTCLTVAEPPTPTATFVPSRTRTPTLPPTSTPTATPAVPVCGNHVVEAGEECDDGGICIGGANAGTACTAESQCIGQGVCTQGIKIGTACDGDADCPGAKCIHCKAFGGDGCAANCTTETDIPYTLKSAPLVKQCLGGANIGQVCKFNTECPGSLCLFQIQPGNSGAFVHDGILNLGLSFSGSQTLTVSKVRDGIITAVIKTASVQLPKIPVSLVACACVRAVTAKTCGGTLFDKDGNFSVDCSDIFSDGASLCPAEKPCTFVHGPGNSSSGIIGCGGLEGINLYAEQDAGGQPLSTYPPAPTPPAGSGPAIVTLSGAGGAGSAIILNSSAIGTVTGSCENNTAAGADKSMCTDDDPPVSRGPVQTLPQVTGTATGILTNTQASTQGDLKIGPASYTGASYDCAELGASPPTAEGANVVGAFTGLNQSGTGDIVVRNSFVIGPRK